MVAYLTEYLKNNRLLIFFFVIFFFLRLPLLDHAFLLRGERDITLTGYALAKTGKDLYGNFLPLQFLGLDMPTPFLAFYYSALWWLIIPIKSVFTARLPYIFISSFNLIFIYELIKIITKNKKLAIISTVIFCFSPGIYHLSRLALEVNLATPLLLLAMVLYLRQKKMISWFIFILAFFTYNGFRPLIPFLIVYLEWWLFLTKKRDSISRPDRSVGTPSRMTFVKNISVALIAYLLICLIALQFIDGQMMKSRSSDLVFIGYESINPLVDLRRNTAVGPTILKQITNNKITNTVYYIIEVFFEGQSLDYLFLKGDKAAIYATTFTGQFFVIALLFYYLGIINLGKLWKKEYFYILGFIPIALIPSLINIDYISIAIRSILASVSYAMIIGLGLILFWDLIKQTNKIFRITIYLLLITIASIELSYFSYNYFFRRPVTMFESFFESEKQIAQYLTGSDKKLVIYDDSPKNIMTAYYLINSKVNIDDLQRLLQQENNYKFDNYLLKRCPDSGKKQQMFKKGSIISDACLDKDQYDKLNDDGNVDKIKFKDYSFRTAYFVIN